MIGRPEILDGDDAGSMDEQFHEALARSVENINQSAKDGMVAESTADAVMEVERLELEQLDEERKKENGDGSEASQEETVQTPPSSPTHGKQRPSLFSLAQVSSKLGELWTSAREQIFGEDYWIPTDPNEIVYFPNELLRAHKVLFPSDDNSSVLRVVQGSLKNRPGIPLHHVVFAPQNPPAYSLFRSNEMEDAVDLCRRCLECKPLFSLLEENQPIGVQKKRSRTYHYEVETNEKGGDTRKPIQELIAKLKENPLWRMIHVAIACNREDLFSERSVDFMNKNAVPFKVLSQMMAHPEGKYPLHLAIEMHRLTIVRRMLELGADPIARDIHGNNALHYASLASVQMLELLWDFQDVHPLLNQVNNEGSPPVMLAIKAANPRCLATLLSFGAEMSIRVSGKNPLFEALQSKGKNTDLIKTILDANPDLLKERDASGNTALHVALYKPPLMGLLLLKHDEMDVNAKNNAGQAAIHMYTHKNEIGLIITLASYCCDINVRDSNGNTALHIAVSKRNLEATRLLLCLGADPNVANNHEDTPRHLAARLRENDLLKALSLCGAARCEPSKTGCVSGCVNEKMLGLLKTNSVLDDCASGKTEEVKVKPDEFPVKDFTQAMFYDCLIDRLESLLEKGERPRNLVNLLSMDGGGIRGLVIIQMLMSIEEVLGEPVYPYFDWVAGTSTGALVAAALAQGKTLRECQHIYLRFKDLIFDGWTRPYNSLVLEQFMKEQVGEDSLGAIKYPRLMISTVKADYFPVKLEFMRNYRLPLTDDENEKLGFTDPCSVPTWKALRRTSAAPMFFSPVDDKYIDGGIIANNPTIDLLAEVQLHNSTSTYLKSPSDKVQVGCVLSLGTGQIPLTPMDPLHVEFTNPISSAFAFKNLSLILVDQVTATEGAPVDRSRSWCDAIGVPFFRLSAPLFKDIGLGTKDDHDIAHMMWDCIEYTHAHRPQLEKLCRLLKLMGRYDQRSCSLRNEKTREMCTQTSTPSTPLI